MTNSSSSEEEVDYILAEIDKKYQTVRENDDNDNDNFKLALKLLQEFDALGISFDQENKNIVTEVLLHTFTLLNIHRRTLMEVQECSLLANQLKIDNFKLQNKIILSKYKNLDKSKADSFCKKLTLLQLKYEDLLKEKSKLQQELLNVKKAAMYKESKFQHKIQHLCTEKQLLQDSLTKNVGKYTSRDCVIADVLHKYKMDEIVYKDTIQKLQENNHELLTEILKLKEETLCFSSKKKQ